MHARRTLLIVSSRGRADVIPSAASTQLAVPPEVALRRWTGRTVGYFNEAKSLGGDGVTTPYLRTADETEIAFFCWRVRP